jgi:hypothetical protein
MPTAKLSAEGVETTFWPHTPDFIEIGYYKASYDTFADQYDTWQ